MNSVCVCVSVFSVFDGDRKECRVHQADGFPGLERRLQVPRKQGGLHGLLAKLGLWEARGVQRDPCMEETSALVCGCGSEGGHEGVTRRLCASLHSTGT